MEIAHLSHWTLAIMAAAKILTNEFQFKQTNAAFMILPDVSSDAVERVIV